MTIRAHHRFDSKIPILFALSTALLALTACPKKKEEAKKAGPAEDSQEVRATPESPEGAPKKKGAPTMADLHPSIAEEAEEGAVPHAIAIEFSQPVVRAQGEKVDPKTFTEPK